jgi:hypothetical protein
MFDLKPPRHTSTLPRTVVPFVPRCVRSTPHSGPLVTLAMVSRESAPELIILFRGVIPHSSEMVVAPALALFLEVSTCLKQGRTCMLLSFSRGGKGRRYPDLAAQRPCILSKAALSRGPEAGPALAGRSRALASGPDASSAKIQIRLRVTEQMAPSRIVVDIPKFVPGVPGLGKGFTFSGVLLPRVRCQTLGDADPLTDDDTLIFSTKVR